MMAVPDPSPVYVWRSPERASKLEESDGCIKEIGDFLEWVAGDYQDRNCGFSGRGFDTRGYFLL